MEIGLEFQLSSFARCVRAQVLQTLPSFTTPALQILSNSLPINTGEKLWASFCYWLFPFPFIKIHNLL